MTVMNMYVNAVTERYSFAWTVKLLLSNERAVDIDLFGKLKIWYFRLGT
jgi:hypothetical protein